MAIRRDGNDGPDRPVDVVQAIPNPWQPGMKSRWRKHNGIAFFHLDYAGFKADINALRAEVALADAEMMREPKGTVLVLIDLTDTVASGAVVQMFKESSAVTTPYIARHALIGITGVKRFLADKVARLSGQPMRIFKSEDAALEWLTSGRAADGDGEVIGLPHAGLG